MIGYLLSSFCLDISTYKARIEKLALYPEKEKKEHYVVVGKTPQQYGLG
jgi:hypothetical protein